jgi:hypothetical protein
MALPKLDIPVNLLMWEVSLPEKLQIKQFGGNALATELFPTAAENALMGSDDYEGRGSGSGEWAQSGVDFSALGPGQIGGIVTDPNGAVVPGATIEVTNSQTGTTMTTRSDGDGHWALSGLRPGASRIAIDAPGFRRSTQDLQISGDRPTRLGTTMEIAGATETVTVTANNMTLDGINHIDEQARKKQEEVRNAPSQNVINLQRRVAGILPVRVEVPRSGKSYRFVRPLVLDEETLITFQYKVK